MPKGKTSVQQAIGKRKTTVATAKFEKGNGAVKINGVPVEIVQPEMLRSKLMEPLLIAGKELTKNIDINISAIGGGTVSQIYAIRQAIARAILANVHDDAQRQNLRESFVKYDRHLVVSDARRAEAKKFGGPGARARRQKSYR